MYIRVKNQEISTVMNTYKSKKNKCLIAEDAIKVFHQSCIDGFHKALVKDVDAGK